VDHHVLAEPTAHSEGRHLFILGRLDIVVQLGAAKVYCSKLSYYGYRSFGKRLAPPKLNIAFAVLLFNGDWFACVPTMRFISL
jgi:hypothetical protein